MTMRQIARSRPTTAILPANQPFPFVRLPWPHALVSRSKQAENAVLKTRLPFGGSCSFRCSVGPIPVALRWRQRCGIKRRSAAEQATTRSIRGTHSLRYREGETNNYREERHRFFLSSSARGCFVSFSSPSSFVCSLSEEKRMPRGPKSKEEEKEETPCSEWNATVGRAGGGALACCSFSLCSSARN